MRQATRSIVITFENTTSAIAMERFCEELHLPGRIAPLPSVLRAGCGMCYKAPIEAEDEIMNALDNNPAILWDEMYELDF